MEQAHDEAGQQQGGHRRRGEKLRRPNGQVVIDVMGARQQPEEQAQAGQKRQRCPQQPDDGEQRQAADVCGPPVSVNEGIQPGDMTAFTAAETDDHQLAHVQEADGNGDRGHHQQGQHAQGVEEEGEDGLIGDHALGTGQEKQLEQQTHQRGEQGQGHGPGQDFRQQQLAPAGAEVPCGAANQSADAVHSDLILAGHDSGKPSFSGVPARSHAEHGYSVANAQSSPASRRSWCRRRPRR